MEKFIKIFKKVNGVKVLQQYRIAGVLGFALLQTALLGVSKKSLEIVRLSVNNRILNKLRRKYRSFIKDYMENNNSENFKMVKSNKVWVCWFQGIENAPVIVKKCYDSLRNNLIGKEIILITEDNYREYIQFPDIIQKKIDNNIIPAAQKSDLIRLELLIKYGGTWIDSTVYCSGSDYPEYMMNSDLFLFQNLKPGLDGHCTSISNWFITSCSNNPILLLVRSMLFDYWSKNDKLIDYFIFHHFFQLAIEAYPEEWEKVIPFNNSTPHILLLRLFENYNEYTWNCVKDMSRFHKLTYKFSKEKENLKNTYYDYIINERLKSFE